MKILSTIFRFLHDGILPRFKKPPPPSQRPPAPQVHGYTYWQYREDLVNPSFTIEDILSRSGGNLPSKPRHPKAGEVWEFRRCRLHENPDWLYPVELKFDPQANYWPFLFCGCLDFVHDGKRP